VFLFRSLFFFFFYCYCDHLDLHSFPTRRSSDLDSSIFCEAADVYLEGFPAGSLTALLEAGEAGLACVRAPAQVIPPFSSDGAGRSEEHTSELQSRGHLVCRLLLEKKKKK